MWVFGVQQQGKGSGVGPGLTPLGQRGVQGGLQMGLLNPLGGSLQGVGARGGLENPLQGPWQGLTARC